MSRADQVLMEIERMAARNSLPIVGPRKGRILIKVIQEVRPRRVLEVGTLIGYSAILMGKELEGDARLITITLDPDEARMAEENIRRAEIPPTVEVILGDAIKVLPRLEEKFDLVFIDADKREYLDYLRLVEEKLRKGSIVAADNAGIFADQMGNYLDYVRSSGRYSSSYMAVGADGVEVSVKL